jgi:hypothetical protein
VELVLLMTMTQTWKGMAVVLLRAQQVPLILPQSEKKGECIEEYLNGLR